MKMHQRGISLIGMLFVAALLGCSFIIGAQVAPMFIEFQAITKAASKAATGSTVPEVRSLFDKAAQIDDIKSSPAKTLMSQKLVTRLWFLSLTPAKLLWQAPPIYC